LRIAQPFIAGAYSPLDADGQKQVINDAAKRAVVITQDRDAADTNRVLYIGADNRAAGRQAGELIKEALLQGGEIVEDRLTFPRSQSRLDMARSFFELLW
jgi:ribose transport system substrate-binding protein